MSYQLYPSDLTDREWEYINRLIPTVKPDSRKRQTDMRLTVNAIFYINCTGSQLLVAIHSAGSQGRDGARAGLAPLASDFSNRRKILADRIFNGGTAEWIRNLRQRNRLDLEIVKRPEGVKGFLMLAGRWVVGRSFAWRSSHRRLSKGYESLLDTRLPLNSLSRVSRPECLCPMEGMRRL